MLVDKKRTKVRGVSIRKHSGNTKAWRVSGIIPVLSSGERKDGRAGVQGS